MLCSRQEQRFGPIRQNVYPAVRWTSSSPCWTHVQPYFVERRLILRSDEGGMVLMSLMYFDRRPPAGIWTSTVNTSKRRRLLSLTAVGKGKISVKLGNTRLLLTVRHWRTKTNLGDHDRSTRRRTDPPLVDEGHPWIEALAVKGYEGSLLNWKKDQMVQRNRQVMARNRDIRTSHGCSLIQPWQDWPGLVVEINDDLTKKAD